MTYTALDDGRAGMNANDRGEAWVRTHHPYDLADYHWAFSRDGEVWEIYLGERRMHTNPVFCGRAFCDATGVVEVLRTFDRKASIKSCIDKS
jgi:hypothetical protein